MKQSYDGLKSSDLCHISVDAQHVACAINHCALYSICIPDRSFDAPTQDDTTKFGLNKLPG